jgi:hypothetical protein
LVGWWKLDDGAGTTAEDSSGGGNTLTLTDCTWTTNGMIGGGLSFNGIDSRAVASDPPALQLAGSWSVAAWANLAALPAPGHYGMVVNKRGGPGDNYDIMIDNGHVGAGIGWRGDFNATACCDDHFAGVADSPMVGVWYHLAVVYDASAAAIALYVNGNPAASASVAGAVPESGAGPLSLGNSGAGLGPFAGTIDDVRVFDRALTGAEVGELYAAR